MYGFQMKDRILSLQALANLIIHISMNFCLKNRSFGLGRKLSNRCLKALYKHTTLR